MELLKKLVKSKDGTKTYTNFIIVIDGVQIPISPAGKYGTKLNSYAWNNLNRLAKLSDSTGKE